MEVEKYILEEEILDKKKFFTLMRIVMYPEKGQQGEIYEDGEWVAHRGALSYQPDPFPGDYINEARAKEVMKLIDKQ